MLDKIKACIFTNSNYCYLVLFNAKVIANASILNIA